MSKLLACSLTAVGLALVSCSSAGSARAPLSPAACRLDQTVENPLHDPRRIADVQVLTAKGRRGNVLTERKQGLAITLKPERAVTREWLSHVLECDAASPHPADASCPLSLADARVSVDSVQGRLVVYVRYPDPKTALRAAELAARFHAH